MNLGTAPDTGQWGHSVGCAFSNDPNNLNLVTCAVLSSSGAVYAIKFDPRLNQATGINGPFISGVNRDLSCVTLAIDNNQITCGAIATSNNSVGGNAIGFNVPFASGL
jgi:hypothetical protein